MISKRVVCLAKPTQAYLDFLALCDCKPNSYDCLNEIHRITFNREFSLKKSTFRANYENFLLEKEKGCELLDKKLSFDFSEFIDIIEKKKANNHIRPATDIVLPLSLPQENINVEDTKKIEEKKDEIYDASKNANGQGTKITENNQQTNSKAISAKSIKPINTSTFFSLLLFVFYYFSLLIFF